MSESAGTFSLMGGRLHVYKRPGSRFWQCSAYEAGKNRRATTKEQSLARAKEVAEDWYLDLRGKLRSGEIKTEKTFKDAAVQFEREYEIITEGERNAQYVAGHKRRLKLHLIPFFGSMGLSEISPGQVQEYRIHRRQKAMELYGKPPARNTMHQEIVCLRQVLKTALRHGWLQHLPDLSEPYRSSGKVSHRAWFSPDEYRQLYTATRKRAREAKGKRWQWHAEQLHDYVLFMANTGLRPDEASRLEFRDVKVVDDSDEEILEIVVRGKRGVGYCMSMPGAVTPYRRILKRNAPETMTARLFPIHHREMLNAVLAEEALKFDREGNRRTAYSLRHTYICLRLMEGADIYQIAKNCRTSVEMIEKYYAVHLRTALDVAAINVRRERPKTKQAVGEGETGAGAAQP
ncbi:MAG: site-specific integrase [Alphaproteobacteria bacterium]